MRQEHGNWHLTTLGKGANTSDDKEYVGSPDASGEYIISRNGRPTSTKGNTGSHEKINGEELKWARNIAGAYRCIGARSVNSNVVELWASPNVPAEPPLIRVNGVIVCQNILLPVTYNNPLQIDKNEDENGGEIFITDNVPPASGVGTPMIFNIQDMIDSLAAASTKYFAGFDPKIYSVNLFIPMDMPVFVELTNVGGGGGLPVGAYSYQLRYSNDAGDRTNLSQRTPEIPVVQNLSEQSAQYPGVKTYGQDPNPDFGTRYGVRLRFRVTNLQGYDFVEIIRTSYNTNGGIDFVPAPKVIAKIDIFNGEISVREFVDPVESNVSIAVSDEDLTREITYINAAKAIRYYDRRLELMNVELASKESQLTYKDVNGKIMFPAIDNLGTIGFNDVYNFVYKKAYMHGERIGFGVEVYDGVGGRGFVNKVTGFTNYMIPNRREETSAETDLYSYGGVVRTTNIFNSVTNTHEVFEHYSAIRKEDKCSFKNIYHNQRASSVIGTKANVGPNNVTEDCDETIAEIETHGAEVYTLLNVSPYYHPYTPTKQNDANVEGHNYRVNTQVCKSQSGFVRLPPYIQPTTGDREFYQPKIFAPNYYSQGMCLAGVDSFPLWAKAFSVVRTEPAKRVIAQGLGMYKLIPAQFNKNGTNDKLCTKDLNRFWFFSPDIENGIVSGKLIDDIIESPESYEVQFVSPLGFASEVYSFDNKDIWVARDRSVDIIAYARMMRDDLSASNSGEINPMEDPGMGYVDGGYNYVGYGKWRNQGQQPGLFYSGDYGNNTFNVTEALRIAEGRGTYMEIAMDKNIYGKGSTGGTTSADFEDSGMQDFTEPFYIVNIIAKGAIVRDQNIENYRITSHYQKLESIIGEGDGSASQKYILVDERWEDAIPALSSSHPTAVTDRFVYIKDPDTGVEEQWVNVTYKTAGQIATIAADIAAGVGTIRGMYRHEIIDTNNRFFNIVFSVPGFIPADGMLIIIKYDNTAPIRFWGGDAIVGESIFAPIDREASANGEGFVSSITTIAPETQFQFGIGFPYRLWKMNPRVYQIKRTRLGGLPNVIQDRCWGYLGSIRQMCIMFTAETRIILPYAHNNAYPNAFFPLINYVMRPHRWDKDRSLEDNNIYPEYAEDYGADEMTQWKWGGFRFHQNINPDYSTVPPKEFVSKPDFGFVEQLRFKDRVMWSLPRSLTNQKSPGLKTFPANNSFDIDDNQGEIKYAYSSTTDKGDNLYAITNKGVCLLLTKKSILSDVNASELGYMSSSSFIKNQYWLTKNVGMFDEFWRTAVEAFVPVQLQDGSEVRVEALLFANNESVFQLMENRVSDIGRVNYHNTIHDKILRFIQPGYATAITAGYDEYNQEYWLHINTEDAVRTEVWGAKNKRWYGYNDYRFDRFVSVGETTYGMRDLETYQLGVGYVLNGSNIIYEATGVSAPKEFIEKEFIRIQVTTGENVKPTAVEIYDKYEGPVVYMIDQATFGPLYMKRYDSWQAFIGRKLVSVSSNRDRVQGRSVVWKVIHTLPEEFRIVNVGILYKALK